MRAGDDANESDTPAFPENEHYGCVDCGSINHTTGDVLWCLVAQERARSGANPDSQQRDIGP